MFERELFEQPRAICDSIDGSAEARAEIGSRAQGIKRVVMVGSGDPFYLGHASVPAWEEFSGSPAETVEAYDFVISRARVIGPETLVIATSASGKSIHTLNAVDAARSAGAITVSVTNDGASPVAAAAEYRLITQAGPTGTFPTKTTTSALATILALAADHGLVLDRLSVDRHRSYLAELREAAPNAIQATLDDQSRMTDVATTVVGSRHLIFVGSGPTRASSLLGAAKVRETSHEHAHACNAEEYLHLVGFAVGADSAVVIIATAPQDNRAHQVAVYASRYAGSVVVFAAEPAERWAEGCSVVPLTGSGVHPTVAALCAIVPVQLLALELSRLRATNADRPPDVDLQFVLDLLYTSRLHGWT